MCQPLPVESDLKTALCHQDPVHGNRLQMAKQFIRRNPSIRGNAGISPGNRTCCIRLLLERTSFLPGAVFPALLIPVCFSCHFRLLLSRPVYRQPSSTTTLRAGTEMVRPTIFFRSDVLRTTFHPLFPGRSGSASCFSSQWKLYATYRQASPFILYISPTLRSWAVGGANQAFSP